MILLHVTGLLHPSQKKNRYTVSTVVEHPDNRLMLIFSTLKKWLFVKRQSLKNKLSK